jgi:hypothetical protein
LPGLQEQAVLEVFLKHHAMVLTMGCVDKAWKRNKSGAAVMRCEVVRWLEALDRWYRERWGEKNGVGEWEEKMKAVGNAVMKW